MREHGILDAIGLMNPSFSTVTNGSMSSGVIPAPGFFNCRNAEATGRRFQQSLRYDIMGTLRRLACSVGNFFLASAHKMTKANEVRRTIPPGQRRWIAAFCG